MRFMIRSFFISIVKETLAENWERLGDAEKFEDDDRFEMLIRQVEVL